MFRGATGTPMRRMALANSRFADAEPEPLTLANLTTKSLTARMGDTLLIPLPPCTRGSSPVGSFRCLRVGAAFGAMPAAAAVQRLRWLEIELLHVPGEIGRASCRDRGSM